VNPAGETSRDTAASESKPADSLNSFRELIAETVSWCTRRADAGPPGEALRSLVLVPPPALSWSDTLRSVADRRRQLLGRSWWRSLEPMGGGVLIHYRPTPPHSRGSARDASGGYFDERDTPPWDTWVSYVEDEGASHLIAWVPRDALAAATAGLAAAPGSLAWANDPA